MAPDKFNDDETKEIIKRGLDLMQRGYFSGINLIQSETNLPLSSIIIHFLHNSQEHIDEMRTHLSFDHVVVPRFTFYSAKPSYLRKRTAELEYAHATFFDDDLNELSFEQAANEQGFIVRNRELDLIIPYSGSESLLDLVKDIREADLQGPDMWEDPVLILRTLHDLTQLPDFFRRFFVSISKTQEEFYTILTDEKRVQALENYLNRVCAEYQIGSLRRSDVVFSPSQVNKEFAKYLASMQNQLEPEQ